MAVELKIPAQKERIGEGIAFIESVLNKSGVKRKDANRSILAAEELLGLLILHAPSEDTDIRISIRSGKGHARISLYAKGSGFSIADTQSARMGLDLESMDEEQEEAIRALLLSSLSDTINVRRARGVNHVTVTAGERSGNRVSFTLICMLLGLVFGALLRLMPTPVSSFISSNVLSVVSTLFLNSIKMLVVPLVFFSIADSVTGFSDLKVFGRIGGKVMGLYTFTSVMAFFIGVAMIVIFHPGDPALRNMIMAMAETSNVETAEIMTLPKIITNIVPANFIGAFLGGDMLQIIFMGLIVGIASGMIGKYSEGVQNFLKAGNALFSQIAKLFVGVTPAAVACIMAEMVLKLDADSLGALMLLVLCSVLGIALLFGLYTLLLVVLAHKDPRQFFRKFRPALLTGMSTMSSNASLPAVMECVDAMGVSPKLYSFSIPLGSTVNMDGATIFYTIVVMFMMRVFGIEMNFAGYVSLFLNVLLVAAATPGIPNATIVMLAILFAQFGIPAGAVAFVLGFNSLIGIIRVPANITGDAVVATVVAANEGMMDDEKYNGTAENQGR